MKLSEYLKQNNMTTKDYFEMQNRRSKGKATLTDYRREKRNSLSQTINFDTFESDLNAMGTTIKDIYDNWQTEETMRNTRSSVESMKTRIDAYREYQKMFGGVDLADVADSYNAILEDWDNRTSIYGQFKNADAYKAEKKRLDLSDQFRVKTGTDAKTGEDTYRGLTFDEVQAKLKEYALDSDEYKFLSTYTGYTDLNDFNKALESANAKVKDVRVKNDAERNAWLSSAEGKEAKEVYDNWEIPKIGQFNEKATKEKGIITYYTQKDVEEAKAARDAYIKRVTGYSFEDPKGDVLKATESFHKELEMAKNRWELDHTFDLYKHIMQNEDFEETSQYWDGYTYTSDDLLSLMSLEDVTVYDDTTWSGTSGKKKIYYVTTDPLYEYINNQNNAQRNLTYGQSFGSGLGSKYERKGYNQLYPEEVGVYNTLYAEDKKNGTNKAQQFLDDMEITLTNRANDKESAKLEEIIDSGGAAAFGANIASIPAKIASAIGGVFASVEETVTGKEYNPYHSVRTGLNFASDVRKYTGENIAEATEGLELFGQNIPSFLYNTGMSMADSAASTALFKGFSPIIMGSSAFQEKAREMKEAGESEENIFATALASGLAEVVFEKISVDRLLKIKNIDSGKKIFTEALKQAGIEGSEEMFTEIANILSDTVIRGDNSELAKKYDELKRRGFSESEINRELAKQVGSQVGWASIGGMLSGLGMGGGKGVMSFATNSSKGKSIRDNERVGDMLDTVKLTPTESAAYKAYDEYAKKGISADNITNAQLGNLYNLTSPYAQVNKDIERGIEKVDTDNVELKRVRELTKSASGKSANIEGIKIGDETTIVTPDGEVALDKISLNQKDAEVVAYAESIGREYGGDVANLFIAQYDGQTDVSHYANSFNLVMEYAKHNYTQDTILENKGVLSYGQVKNIYEATVKATFEEQQKLVDAITERQSKTVFVQGKVDDSIIDYDNKTTDGSKVRWDKLSSQQRRAIKFVQLFAKATGVNIRFIKSEIVDGKHKGENGSYDPKTNTITLDVYAGRIDATSTKDAILPTLSHELTHWMKAKAPAIYNSIREDIFGVLAKDNRILSDERVLAEMQRMKKAHPNQEVTPEDAIDEIVARACEDMLKNSNEMRKLLAKMSATEQQTFIEKVKETFENLMQWINDLLSHYKSESYEARFLSEYKTELKKISKQWDEMLKSAIEANQALQKESVNGAKLAKKISKAQKNTTQGDVRFSERDYPIDVFVESTVKQAYFSGKSSMHELSKITAEQNKAINRLGNTTNNDLYKGKYEGGKHKFSDTAIRHIIKEHGDFLREGLRAQLPMTLTDVARHLSAIKDNKKPDSIKATKTKQGNPSILTSYQVNGYTLYAEEITKPLGNKLPSDLIGHTMYKAPTLSTAAFYATSAQTQPKRQSEVLCSYYMPNSTELSMANFVSDENGGPALLKYIAQKGIAKQDASLLGLIALSSDETNLTDKSGDIEHGYVRCKKPFYITQDSRVFSNSETNVAENISKLKNQGYDCFIFDKTVGDNYMVAVVNKSQIVKNKPIVQFSDRDAGETAYDKSSKVEKKGIQYSDRQHYWKSGFSHAEMTYVERIANHEVELTDNYIDAGNKWLYNDRKEKPYFALYSTAHIDSPTVMYASKGGRAINEYKWFMRFIETLRSVDNGNYERSTRVLNKVLEDFWNDHSTNNRNSGNALGRGNNIRNVGTPNPKSNFRPSEALFNCLRNITETQERESGLKKSYSDRLEESVYDKIGETNRILKENEKLKADVERLRERLKIERQVTHGNYFNENQLDAVAGHLRRISGSRINKAELINRIKEVYSYIAYSEALNWDDMFAMCSDVARIMIEEAPYVTETNDYAKMILDDIRTSSFWVNEKQKGDARYKFGKKWYQMFFGKTHITDKASRSLDQKWQEWADEYPDVFDATISDADMLVELYNIYDQMKNASEIVVDYYGEEQVRWLAMEIYNQYWNVSTIKTTADRYDKQIKRLNFEHRKAMQEFRNDYEERMAEQKKTERERTKKLVEKLRERKEREVAEAKQLGKERLEKYKENAERKTKIQSITSNALTLNKWLVKNSKDYHIHEAMKGPVVKLLQAIDFSSKQKLEKGTPTQKDVSFAEAFAEVKSMLDNAQKFEVGLEELYGHDLAEDIDMLVKASYNLVGDNNFVINQMSLEELKHLERLVKYIKRVVTDINKFHSTHHNQGAIDLSNRFIEYGNKLGKLKKQDGTIAKFLKFRNCTPLGFFNRLGEAGRKLFEALQDGWDKFAFNIKEIYDFTKKTYTSKEVKQWSKETREFTVNQINGEKRTFNMSIAQIMALHCVWKQDDAKRHLLTSGMTLSRLDNKGNVVAEYENILLSQSDIGNILSVLDKIPKAKEVADKLQEFMNTVCSDWGNKISLARFGVKMFGLTNYFPIKVSPSTIPGDNTKEIESASLFRLLNMSFTKSRNEYANQSIEIGDIFDIFAQHTTDMAKYNAFALQILDFNKFYSYTVKDDVGKEYGVENTLKTVFGEESIGYIKRFIRDLNGTQKVSRNLIVDTLTRKAKLVYVANNLRVILLQPTAFHKASAILDNKYLIKAGAYVKVNPVSMVGKLKKAIEKAEKYCGILQWKALGYYDTDIGKGVAEKVKQADTWWDKAIELSTKGMEIADKVTFGTLWVACEFETRETRKDLTVGSDEFNQAIAKRLREVIYATQVVDSTMTRSDIMRSSDGMDKVVTTFGSETTVAYNMLMDVAMQYSLDKKELGKKESWEKNGKKIRKTITAYVVHNAVAALVESCFDVFRDSDEEEEMNLEEFMKLYFKNLYMDLSIVNKIPWIKEIYSIAQGYSSSRMDTQLWQHLTGMASEWGKIISGIEGRGDKAIKNTLQFASDITGFAFYNIYRDAIAALYKLDILDIEDIKELFDDWF